MAVGSILRRSFLLFFLAFTGIGVIAETAHAAAITDYRPIFQPCRVESRSSVAIREFRRDGVELALIVDAATAVTRVVPRKAVAVTKEAAAGAYRDGLKKFSEGPHRLQNDGITHSEGAAEGVILTVDLCPSVRQFEQGLFEAAAQLSPGKPAPVAVAITGVWLERHPRELEWLLAQENAGRLAITWVNHSHNHPYQPGAPLDKTFLLTAGTDFDGEIFKVEKVLLERGLTPSVFFRFPGLVSDAKLVKRLGELGLIALGADAWLAKGEKPVPGSIILVHGNGNEPKGISLFRSLIDERKGRLNLVPLQAAISGGRVREARNSRPAEGS